LDEKLKSAIRDHTHFICLLGQVKEGEQIFRTLDSDWVKQEIKYAKSQGKTCIPFFQHNWKDYDSEDTDIQEFLRYDGVAVQGVHNEYDPTHAKTYDTALRDVLPFLGISRV